MSTFSEVWHRYLEERNGIRFCIFPRPGRAGPGHQDADGITLKGGGYGHGVGMSQTAANEMAKEGYSYEEILEYFFREIEFVDIYGVK